MINQDRIIDLANKHGWVFICKQSENCMISFMRSSVRINIWPSKGTVATAMDHPRKGKTQLYRRGLNINQIEEILINPRQHTGRGYYTRGVNNAKIRTINQGSKRIL